MSPLEKLTAALAVADQLSVRAGVGESIPRWGGKEFCAAWLRAENDAIDAAAEYAGIERTAPKLPPKLPPEVP